MKLLIVTILLGMACLGMYLIPKNSVISETPESFQIRIPVGTIAQIVQKNIEKPLMNSGVDKLLIGSWVFDSKDDEGLIRHIGLQYNAPGWQFFKGGKFISRSNNSWCGTPPITYKNFEGSWTLQADSILTLRYAFWGGKVLSTRKIIAIDRKRLTLESIADEFLKKEDQEKLIQWK